MSTLKKKLLIEIAIGLVTGISYLILISHSAAYEAYCRALRFLPAIVIDFVLPLIPPLAAGLLLGKTGKERKELSLSGIFTVVILVLLAMMYTLRLGGFQPTM